MRSLEDSLVGLDLLRHAAKGSRILDLGCAEGLISQWCLEYGAESVYGLDANVGHIMKARNWAEGLKGIEFDLADFNDIRTIRKDRYDVVLALSVIHKLRDECRIPFLSVCCRLAVNWLFLRAPSKDIRASLQGQSSILDLVAYCEGEGMQCIEQRLIVGQPWVGVFRCI